VGKAGQLLLSNLTPI